MLTPNYTYVANGVTVNEKIIPDGTVWKDGTKASAAGFYAGALYKKQQKLSGGTGKVKKVTVHNTNDLPKVEDDGEQYTRATYNENMGSSRVHFYVDDLCAWQNLKAGTGSSPNDPMGSAEIGWHAGDGSRSGGGNASSLGIEIIMNDNAAHDAKAYDNGARLCAWLLYEHGLAIDDLVTHSFWNAKWNGKTNADIDKQCVTKVGSLHWCPLYIFNSSTEAGALPNWRAFKAVVKKYLDELQGISVATTPVNTSVVYRVQVGSFRNKTYAKAFLADVQEHFPDAYIKQYNEYYRVQVGAFRVKENAEAYLKLVQQTYLSAYITVER